MGGLDTSSIATEENGRPYFPDRGADFNISHSGNMAAVALIRSNAEKIRTGCDIQIVKPRLNAKEIAEKCFKAAERDYITDDVKFFHIWTLKECYLKLNGLSVFDMEKVPAFIRENVFSFESSSPLTFFLYELSGADERYILASAAGGIDEKPELAAERATLHRSEVSEGSPPELHWFSQGSLVVRSIAEINAAASPPVTVSPNM
jgi:hypothetical protein